ncbi:acyltransferase [Methylotenera sp.]|uniref:acyltransferase family protein n=1 Tax=Methylotenera sp. TaxID=2051956 RepID=UPI002489FF6F|nr:acyltransferase [Methylotenera sp.]MDI1298420.1 acyltransferase [Methylotenera sp.]
MRFEKLDLLRFIGLSMIILAHSSPGPIIFQLRNFDVPLMVLLSGAVFGISYKGENYLAYVWKRFKRLVLPVWIFLTIYFSVTQINLLHINKEPYEVIFNSYTLLSGIGYVWVIRVFLLVALIAPVLYWLNKKQTSSPIYLSGLFGIYLIYEFFAFNYSVRQINTTESFTLQSIFLLVGYGCVFALGLRMPLLKTKAIAFLAGIFLIVFATYSLYLIFKTGGFKQTQEFKYPPTSYYFSYALFVGASLWIFSERLYAYTVELRLNRLVLFIAQNSIWIYMWHIPLIRAVHLVWFIKFPITILGATLITYCQVLFVTKILEPKITNDIARKNLHLVLTG